MAFKAYLIDYKSGDIIREETIIGRPKVYQSIDGEHSADLVIKTTKAALDDDYEPYVRGMVIIEGTSLSSSSKVISAGPIDKSFIEAENNTIKIGLASALDYLSKVQIYPYKAVKDSDDAFSIAKGTTDTRAAQKLLRYPWEEGASSDSSDPAPPSHITVSQLSNGSHSTLKETMKVYYSDGQNVYDAWTELQGIRWGLECAESWSITGSGSSASLRTKLLIYNRFASNKDPLPWKTLPESTMLRYTIEEEPYSITRVIAVSKDSDKDKKIDSDLQHRNKSNGLLLDAFESLSEEATSAEMSDVLSSRLTPEKYSYSTYEIDVFMDGNETDNIGEYLGVRINSGPRRLGSKSRVIGIDHELGSNKYTLEITTAWDARTYPMPSKKKRKDEAKKKKKKRKYRHQKPRKGTNPDYSDWKPGGKYPEKPNTGGGTTPPPTPSDPNDPKPVPDFPNPNDDWNDWDPKPEKKIKVTGVTTQTSLGINAGDSYGFLFARRNQTTFYTLGTAAGTSARQTTNSWRSYEWYARPMLYCADFMYGNYQNPLPAGERPSSIDSIDMNFGSYQIKKFTFDQDSGVLEENKALNGSAVIDSAFIRSLYHSDTYLKSIEGDKIAGIAVFFSDLLYANDKLYLGITYVTSWDVDDLNNRKITTKTKFVSIEVSGDSIGSISSTSLGNIGGEMEFSRVLTDGGYQYKRTASGIGAKGIIRIYSTDGMWFPGSTYISNAYFRQTGNFTSGLSTSGYGFITSGLTGKIEDNDSDVGNYQIVGTMVPIVEGNEEGSTFSFPDNSSIYSPTPLVIAGDSGSIRALYYTITKSTAGDAPIELASQSMGPNKPITISTPKVLGGIKGNPISPPPLYSQRGTLVLAGYDYDARRARWMSYNPVMRSYEPIKLPSTTITTVDGPSFELGDHILIWGHGRGDTTKGYTLVKTTENKSGEEFSGYGGKTSKDLFIFCDEGLLTVKTPINPDGLKVKTTEILIEDTTDASNVMSMGGTEKSSTDVDLSANGFSYGKTLKVSWNIFASNDKFNQNLAGDRKPAYSVSTTITPQSSGTQKSGSVSVIDNWRNGQGPNS